MSASIGTPRRKARNVGKASASPTSTAPFTAPLAMWTPEAIRNLDARHATATWATDPSRLTRFTKESPSWTWFLTATYRKAIKPHLAHIAGKRFVTWCSAWRAFLGGRETGVFRLLLWSAESHMTGDVHVHALSVCTPLDYATHCPNCQGRIESSRKEYQKLKESHWLDHGKMVARRYDPALKFGAEQYVTKYILKPTCLDWGIEEW